MTTGFAQDDYINGLCDRIAALEAALELANHQIEVLRTPPIMIYTTS